MVFNYYRESLLIQIFLYQKRFGIEGVWDLSVWMVIVDGNISLPWYQPWDTCMRCSPPLNSSKSTSVFYPQHIQTHPIPTLSIPHAPHFQKLTYQSKFSKYFPSTDYCLLLECLHRQTRVTSGEGTRFESRQQQNPQKINKKDFLDCGGPRWCCNFFLDFFFSTNWMGFQLVFALKRAEMMIDLRWVSLTHHLMTYYVGCGVVQLGMPCKVDFIYED